MFNKVKSPFWGWSGTVSTASEFQHVIDTDYETYSIVHLCFGFGDWFHNDVVFISAREQSISDSLLARTISIAQEKIPNYDPVNITDMIYQQDEWCQYDDMPVTPDP